jgi:hypothetical protein
MRAARRLLGFTSPRGLNPWLHLESVLRDRPRYLRRWPNLVPDLRIRCSSRSRHFLTSPGRSRDERGTNLQVRKVHRLDAWNLEPRDALLCLTQWSADGCTFRHLGAEGGASLQLTIEDVAGGPGSTSRMFAAWSTLGARTRRRRFGQSGDDSPISLRFFPRAPNWTVLERMSAGRGACAPSDRSSRQASAWGVSQARAPMTAHPVHCRNGAAVGGRSSSERTIHLDRQPSPTTRRSSPSLGLLVTRATLPRRPVSAHG